MDIDELVFRSIELQDRLEEFLVLRPGLDSDRVRVSKIMCAISLEHAESVKMLITNRNLTSAVGLIRLQYETFVRAMWLFNAASDIAVSKLAVDLTQESAKKADQLPMLSEMLKKLDGKIPKEVLDQLLEFKVYSWKSLCSYIHGGLHAVHRHSRGYPVILLEQELKLSNGLVLMTGMLCVILLGDVSHRGKILAIQKEFATYLPDLSPGHSF